MPLNVDLGLNAAEAWHLLESRTLSLRLRPCARRIVRLSEVGGPGFRKLIQSDPEWTRIELDIIFNIECNSLFNFAKVIFLRAI